MSKRSLTFVTGNKNKLEEVKKILGSQGLGIYDELVSKSVDLPELQATNREITIRKCEEAYQIIQGPVIVEDTGLHFEALDDLPGPYIKWFVDRTKLDRLHKMLVGFDNYAAEASCTVAIKESAEKPVDIFEGRTSGTIVVPRGPNTFGWDSCFQPDGYTETYAEMCKETKNRISHRYKAFEMLKSFLLKNGEENLN